MISQTLFQPAPQRHVTTFPFHVWPTPDGDQWVLFYRCDTHYLVRFIDLADFSISIDAQSILVYPVPDVPQDIVDHLYLNLVVPLALSHQKKLVLHASAVEIDDFSVLFTANSGCGKSTLAAIFSTSGFRFLTDDCVQLEPKGLDFFVQPSHPSIRVWGDSRDELISCDTSLMSLKSSSSKFRFMAKDASVFCNEPRLLRRVYFLGGGHTKDVSIAPVSGAEAIVGLVSQTFLLDISEKQLLTKNFEQIARLAQEPIFYRLDYPRNYEILPRVRDTVIRHARLHKAIPLRH